MTRGPCPHPRYRVGGAGSLDPLALRKELGDTECLHGSLQTPPILKEPPHPLSPMGNRAAMREAGPAHLEASLPLCCCPASRPT